MKNAIIREPDFDSSSLTYYFKQKVEVSQSKVEDHLAEDLFQVPYQNIFLVIMSQRIRLSIVDVDSLRYQIANNQHELKKIIKIQSWVRMKIQRHVFIKLIKKSRQRKQVILELVSTEKKYVNYLKILLERVCIPLRIQSSSQLTQDQKIIQYSQLQFSQEYINNIIDLNISNADVISLFSNLEDLLELNSKFSESMNNSMVNISYNTRFANVCVQFAPQLTIYAKYFNNYENGTTTLERLTQQNEKFKQYRVNIEQNELNSLDLYDYLIKPVQRLPKYILLLKELLKCTPNTHPDYTNMMDALDKFEKVCQENNQQMEQFIRENKLMELHRKFSYKKQQQQQNRKLSILTNLRPMSLLGFKSNNNNNNNNNGTNNNNNEANTFCFNEQHQNEGLHIIEQGVQRQFIWEEMLSLFKNNQEIRVTVYFLSDMLLVTSNATSREILIQYLLLSEASFLKNMSDLKYFSNLFRVIGRTESLTFICDSDDTKYHLLSRINKEILIPLKLKAQQRIEIKKKMQNIMTQSSDNQDRESTLPLQKQDQSQEKEQQSKSLNLSHSLQQSQEQQLQSTNIQSVQKQVSSHSVQSLQEQDAFPIQVSVLGTEERSSGNRLKEKFTVYISEIQIGEHVKQKIFVRYREMIELEKYLKKNIKEIKDVPHLSRDLFWHHKTKVIEQRKLLIENFLQKVLSNQLLKTHPKVFDILAFLGLPNNFYSLPLIIGENDFDYLNKDPFISMDGSRNTSLQQVSSSQQAFIPNLAPARPMKVSYFNDNIDNSDGEEESFQYETVDSNKSSENEVNKGNMNSRPISLGASNFYQLNSQKLRNQQTIQKRNPSNPENNPDNPFFQQSQQSCKITESNNIDNRLASSYPEQNKAAIGENSRNSSQLLHEEEKELEVMTLIGTVKVLITKRSKAFDTCIEIARQLNLANYLDFRLFLYVDDDKKNQRLVDDDENIFKLVFNQNTQLDRTSTISNIKNQFFNQLNKLGLKSSSNQSKLKFVKYLWLEQELEEFDYKSDHIRLQLMSAQVLNDIQQRRYILLQIKDYFLYTSLYLFMNHYNLIQNEQLNSMNKQQKNNLLAIIKSFIPPQVIKSQKDNILLDNILVYINIIAEELQLAISAGETIMQKNNAMSNFHYDIKQQQLKEHDEDVENHLLKVNAGILCDRKNLTCMVLLDTFKKNPLYGATLYACQTYKATIKQMKQQFNIIIPSNVLCCVKCDAIHILDSVKQTRIKSFKYREIKETKVFPSSIIFIILNSHSYKEQEEQFSFRLDTTQSFEISSIINAYSDMMIDIQKNALTLDEEANGIAESNNNSLQMVFDSFNDS